MRLGGGGLGAGRRGGVVISTRAGARLSPQWAWGAGGHL